MRLDTVRNSIKRGNLTCLCLILLFLCIKIEIDFFQLKGASNPCTRCGIMWYTVWCKEKEWWTEFTSPGAERKRGARNAASSKKSKKSFRVFVSDGRSTYKQGHNCCFCTDWDLGHRGLTQVKCDIVDDEVSRQTIVSFDNSYQDCQFGILLVSICQKITKLWP